MATVSHDIDHYLELAQGLAEKVAAAADQIDEERQFPPELSAEFADKGFFRLLLPKSLGGAQLAHPDFVRILEVFAPIDGSTGWALNQNNVFSTNSVRMPEATAKKIWGEQRAVVTNGPPTAASQAVPVEGGYRLSGLWHFSSGSTHATWIAALAPVNDGGPLQDASRDRTGARLMLMPKEDVTMLDFWHVRGLRGTASFSFEVEDMFIPAEHSFALTDRPRESDPLYQIPTPLMFATGFSTVAMGVARSALDIASEVARSKVPGRSNTILQEFQATHRTIGEAEAIWGAAKSFLRQSANAAWENVCEDGVLDMEQRIQLRIATTHAIRQSGVVVDMAYGLLGSDAIFDVNPIQRKFQDIHVITQHAQGRYLHYETAGQYYLGLEPQGTF